MLIGAAVGLDAPGQMRHEVTIERHAEPHLIEHARPVQRIAVREQRALITPRDAREHLQGAGIQPGRPADEGSQKLLWLDGQTKLRNYAGSKLRRIDLPGFELSYRHR